MFYPRPPDISAFYRLTCDTLRTYSAGMNGKELMRKRRSIGWNRYYVADRLGCSEATIRAWETGSLAPGSLGKPVPIPQAVADWINDAYASVSRPAPRRVGGKWVPG